MRVISGKYKKRNLKGFNIEGTRPTMDRVKESMFAFIQDKIKGTVCLDLFAGSGALGIEALSNGAECCYFVDNNKAALETLKENINNLNIGEKYNILKYDYEKALMYFYNNSIKFDLILLDPPYKMNYINHTLDLINKYDLLSNDGIIVCEYEEENVQNESFECIKERQYSSKNIKIFKKEIKNY